MSSFAAARCWAVTQGACITAEGRLDHIVCSGEKILSARLS